MQDTRKQHTRIAADERFGRRQPRPAPRRQGTRAAVIAAASKEA